MKILLAILLIAAIGAVGWFGYTQHQDKTALGEHITALQGEITELKGQVKNLEDEVTGLEQRTLDGMVDDANRKLKSGLKNMFKAAEEEFQRLQDTIDETFEELEQHEDSPQSDSDSKPKQTHET